MTLTLPPSRSFRDVDELAESLRDWDLHFRKLDRGEAAVTVRQLDGAGLRVVHLQGGSALEIVGAAPPGMRSFGMPLSGSTPARWCHREATADTVSVYGAQRGFEAATRPGFDSLVLSVSTDLLDAEASALGIDPAKRRHDSEVVTCDPRRLLRLRRSVASVMVEPVPAAGHAARGFRGLVRELLLTLGTGDPRAPASVRAALVARARSHLAGTREAISVRELCRATGASERTLRRAFVEHFGVAPKAYLQARRLHDVRAALRTAPADARVTDVAFRFGFWHLGQFASDYQRLFGELPSQTMSRSTRPAPGRPEVRT